MKALKGIHCAVGRMNGVMSEPQRRNGSTTKESNGAMGRMNGVVSKLQRRIGSTAFE